MGYVVVVGVSHTHTHTHTHTRVCMHGCMCTHTGAIDLKELNSGLLKLSSGSGAMQITEVERGVEFKSSGFYQIKE